MRPLIVSLICECQKCAHHYRQGDAQAAAAVSTAPSAEHKEEEIFDPLAPPDVDK